MLLSVPYHPDVPVDYQRVVQDLKRLAGNTQHSVLVLARPQDEQQALDIAIDLSQSFGRHFVATLIKDEAGPTETANLFLKTALRFLARYRPEYPEPEEVPMLYLDPTWRPRKKHWLDTLQGDWFFHGKPQVMGNYQDPENPDFQGAVVFGPAYANTTTLVDFLPDNEHWRKFLAWEMFKNAVKTDSIGDDPKALVQPRPANATAR